MASSSTQSIRKVAGWLALSVLSTLLFGVLALWLTDRANSRQIEDFNGILRIVDATRLAQVHFKTQVQEWKDLLLRGQDAADYERYLGQFHTESAQVVDELNRAAAMKKAIGLDASDIEAALAAHAALLRQYADVLRGYQRGTLASIFAVDTAVRGRDRPLNTTIDAIAEAMRGQADSRMQAFAQADRRRYQILRAVFVTLSAATLILAGWLVVLTLRRQGDVGAV
ncbi:MAG TPA: hypothetical protein VF921_19815 [Vicinamibacterales bacterium]